MPSKRLCTNSTDGRTSATAGGNGGGGGGSLSARLEKELERTLREFVRMKTVSSDPSLREDCFRGAKYLAHLLESLGTILQHRTPAFARQKSFLASSVALLPFKMVGHYIRLNSSVCVCV